MRAISSLLIFAPTALATFWLTDCSGTAAANAAGNSAVTTQGFGGWPWWNPYVGGYGNGYGNFYGSPYAAQDLNVLPILSNNGQRRSAQGLNAANGLDVLNIGSERNFNTVGTANAASSGNGGFGGRFGQTGLLNQLGALNIGSEDNYNVVGNANAASRTY